ncbi:hypothetical protein [Nostoc sp. 'Peltigera malacea cyanobiont' DB3992]|uniref:hypothetical protein n=1 Tax=Nostoc sp. 'Peltigera malacea cyanobiont' DB3992 TaxID=1206980 RepID=UPI0015D4F527|nr:hypothetical protein [Nostoc sp. 'Peltigera malacea cyanobiont' DB3992]
MILPRAAATIRNPDVQLPIFQVDADGYSWKCEFKLTPKTKAKLLLPSCSTRRYYGRAVEEIKEQYANVI